MVLSPESRKKVFAAGDEINPPANGRGGPVSVPDALESMLEGIRLLLLVRRKALIQSGSDHSVTTGLQREAGGAGVQMRYTPHQAEPDTSDAGPCKEPRLTGLEPIHVAPYPYMCGRAALQELCTLGM